MLRIGLIAVIVLFTLSCQQHYTPKPRGYFRIDMPHREYRLFDSLINYRFEYPTYGHVVTDIFTSDEVDWLNLEFPDFKGSLHLSYKPLNGNLSQYVEDARTMLLQHLPKASGITDSLVIMPGQRKFGIIHQISGKGAASPLQFYLTDSSRHFIRGALYFNIRPNNDSLEPVIDFLRKDAVHLIETIEWK